MPRNVDLEERWLRRLSRAGEFLESLENGHGTQGLEGAEVTSIKVRMKTVKQPEMLLVVQASGEGGEFVAFVGALGLVDAILTWRARDGASGLKWRKHVPWGAREG